MIQEAEEFKEEESKDWINRLKPHPIRCVQSESRDEQVRVGCCIHHFEGYTGNRNEQIQSEETTGLCGILLTAERPGHKCDS